MILDFLGGGGGAGWTATLAGTELGRVCSFTGEISIFEAVDDCVDVC